MFQLELHLTAENPCFIESLSIGTASAIRIRRSVASHQEINSILKKVHMKTVSSIKKTRKNLNHMNAQALTECLAIGERLTVLKEELQSIQQRLSATHQLLKSSDQRITATLNARSTWLSEKEAKTAADIFFEQAIVARAVVIEGLVALKHREELTLQEINGAKESLKLGLFAASQATAAIDYCNLVTRNSEWHLS